MLEKIRDGVGVAELMSTGQKLLGRRQTLPGVPETVGEVQVEGTFPDGTKLLTARAPSGISTRPSVPAGSVAFERGRRQQHEDDAKRIGHGRRLRCTSPSSPRTATSSSRSTAPSCPRRRWRRSATRRRSRRARFCARRARSR
mmetsp:Transcript_13720/g.42483  ORF Transcript_13720/g.42483 Transcript_13720/m.42483 type:complete len:143 (-) Transcript_13720:842-1270(-)